MPTLPSEKPQAPTRQTCPPQFVA